MMWGYLEKLSIPFQTEQKKRVGKGIGSWKMWGTILQGNKKVKGVNKIRI